LDKSRRSAAVAVNAASVGIRHGGSGQIDPPRGFRDVAMGPHVSNAWSMLLQLHHAAS
jgi:hypothetical protein